MQLDSIHAAEPVLVEVSGGMCSPGAQDDPGPAMPGCTHGTAFAQLAAPASTATAAGGTAHAASPAKKAPNPSHDPGMVPGVDTGEDVIAFFGKFGQDSAVKFFYCVR